MHIDHNRIYRTRDLLERYGITSATLWRWRRLGKIPEPLKLNDQNYWRPEQVAEADRLVLGDDLGREEVAPC
jgi:predicted DNA-binding transcriptional regulator AlpA